MPAPYQTQQRISGFEASPIEAMLNFCSMAENSLSSSVVKNPEILNTRTQLTFQASF